MCRLLWATRDGGEGVGNGDTNTWSTVHDLLSCCAHAGTDVLGANLGGSVNSDTSDTACKLLCISRGQTELYAVSWKVHQEYNVSFSLHIP